MIRRPRILAALALAALLAWGNAGAASTAHKPHHTRASHARTALPVWTPARAGLVIAWDPESQSFTMPAPDRSLPLTAEERNAISRSFAGLVQVHHPDGSVSVDLQGRFQEFAVVHLGPDGKPVYQCLDDAATMRRALLEPVPASSGLEDR
jgi:hypothetical protein